MIRKIIYYPLFLFFVFNSIAFSQNWIPLDVGNRWDYFVEIYIHGGDIIYDTLSVEIIDHRLLPNGLEYFEFSSNLLFPLLSSNFLREEDSKFYYFDEENSTDCFALRFDLPIDTFYIDCRGIKKHILISDTTFTFGLPDVHQNQQAFFEFSYNFGLYCHVIPDIAASYYYTLKGCIISDVTYGDLLVKVENENQLPDEYNLFQNYPNPFNPSTNIKFTISDLRFTTMKVYDILGSEIATLVNEEKTAGEYEVEFDGIDLPSGIYFYQLRAGNYVETKKMVLLK